MVVRDLFIGADDATGSSVPGKSKLISWAAYSSEIRKWFSGESEGFDSFRMSGLRWNRQSASVTISARARVFVRPRARLRGTWHDGLSYRQCEGAYDWKSWEYFETVKRRDKMWKTYQLEVFDMDTMFHKMVVTIYDHDDWMGSKSY